MDTGGKGLMRIKTAFSLTELLIVLAILALLAAVLFPVFAQAHAKARQTSCASNLLQISQGTLMYLSDYDGTCPPIFRRIYTADGTPKRDEDWLELITPYTKNPHFRCPDVNLPETMKRNSERDTHATIFSGYAMNFHLSQIAHIDDKKPIGKPESQIQYPSTTVLTFDVRAGIGASAHPDIYPWRPVGQWTKKEITFYALFYLDDIKKQKGGAERHSGGANYAFADGHVKWFKPEQLSADTKNDGLHPGFGL